MEINRNGKGCPRETLPKTTNTIKQNQPKQAKTLANLMEIKGHGRGWPKVPYHKPPQPLSTNSQTHQNHPKRGNLMEITKNGKGCHPRTLPTTAKTTKQKQAKQAKTLANLMEIKGHGRGCPRGPYHKPPKPLSKNSRNHQNQQKRANLMEINKNGRACPRRTLPTTQKTTKQKQPKQAKTLANLMEIKGNGRGCPRGPYHKPPKPLSKNSRNHQNQQKRANLMEINKNGRACPRRTLTTTRKTTKQKQPKQAKTLANLMEIKGNCWNAPRGPTTNHQNH
jgi:hypothetical protein